MVDNPQFHTHSFDIILCSGKNRLKPVHKFLKGIENEGGIGHD